MSEQIIVHEGRCVRLDLSKRPKTLKNKVRLFLGLKPVYPPRVIESWYEKSPIGCLRQKTVESLDLVKKQKLDRSSERATKRDIVSVFRARFPRVRD